MREGGVVCFEWSERLLIVDFRKWDRFLCEKNQNAAKIIPKIDEAWELVQLLRA
jgi:hypothetical protein